MTDAVNRFYNSVEDAESQSRSAIVELFVYYLTVEAGKDCATAKDIGDCFSSCDLAVPGGIGVYLSRGLQSKPAAYIKADGGYKLERHMREKLSKKLGAEQIIVQTSATLRELEHKVPEGSPREFLKETIDCFEVGANRATITMIWILAMDHLFAHILKNKRAAFNAALAQDKGVKINAIAQRDDFTEMKESKFIELCRTGKIISNDVRKILDACLGTRNSCAHPSGIVVKNAKVISFVEDLVENVVLKYEV